MRRVLRSISPSGIGTGAPTASDPSIAGSHANTRVARAPPKVRAAKAIASCAWSEPS